MALTLHRLYENTWYLYEMNIIAGRRGMDNVVQWVHTLEDVETGEFIHGGELIFTTGIAQTEQDPHWLIHFTKEICSREASGIVVNTGPYIKEIPREVIDYCNEIGFPLLQIPWKTRIVDITRDFCNRIFEDEKLEEDVSAIFERLLFHPEEAESYRAELEQKQFHTEGMFCLIGIQILWEEENTLKMHMLKKRMLRKISRISGKYVCFFRDELCFLILNDIPKEEIQDLISRLGDMEIEENYRIHIAAGPLEASYGELSCNFRKVSNLLRIIKNKGKSPLYYDEMGMQKLILAVDDPKILSLFVEKTLGALIRYDEENHTELMKLLKTYLDLNCSVQRVADSFYVHRNTVNYQLGKIKKILDCDLETMKSKFEIMLALQIMEVL